MKPILRSSTLALKAELARADAYWLGVMYADAPAPFWPIESPDGQVPQDA